MDNNQNSLAAAAKKGDLLAFQALYESVYKDLYRYAFFCLKNKQDAEDAVSDTVVDAFAAIGKLRKTEAFSVWIFRILSVKVKRRLKYYALNKEEPIDDVAVFLADHRDFSAQSDLLSYIGNLPDTERQIVLLSVIGCYTGDEIGRTLNLKPSTVRSKLSRSLKKLRSGLLDDQHLPKERNHHHE